MKVSLSVVVITKNEESRIKDCLESVYGWADEIIVIDDESTDKTREIAKIYADKVLIRKMDIEGRHRNWAYAQSKYDWVLSLDADERIIPELKEEISEVLKGSPAEAAFIPLEIGCHRQPTSGSGGLSLTGFTIPRKNFLGSYWLEWGGQYPAPQLKLFLRDKFKWEEVEVHPRAFLEGKCGHLKNPLLHYTYRDFTDFVKKLNSQTTLEAKKWIYVYKTDFRKADYKMNLFHVLWRCLDRFIRTYFAKKGYKDGFIGFMAALFASLYQIVSYAKYWEMKQQLDKICRI